MQSPFESIPDSAWTLFEVTEDYERYFTWVDLAGERVQVVKKVYRADDLLQKANAQEYNESDGKRWGDGRVVARMPLSVWFDQLRDGVRAGDHDHMTHWLNSEKARPFRTFRGRV